MIEVVGSRLGPGLPTGAVNLVADNGMAAFLVHGPAVPVGEAPPLGDITARLAVDGAEKARGTLTSGEVEPYAVLGHSLFVYRVDE
jgi:hypothetical protein